MRDNLKPHAEIELQPLSFASGNREGAVAVSASGLILKEHLLGVLVVVCICPSSQHNVVDKRPENDTKCTSNQIPLFAFSFNSQSLPTLLALRSFYVFLLVEWCVDSCQSIEN